MWRRTTNLLIGRGQSIRSSPLFFIGQQQHVLKTSNTIHSFLWHTPSKTRQKQEHNNIPFLFVQCRNKSTEKLQNSQITATEVMLIDDEGRNIGKVPFKKALAFAKEKKMSLVQVAKEDLEKEQPPICRLMPQNKPPAPATDTIIRMKQKELQFGSAIEEHDVQTKVNRLRYFLDKGMQVKVSIRFATAQDADKELAEAMLDNIFERVEDMAKSGQTNTDARFIWRLFTPITIKTPKIKNKKEQ